MSDKAHYLSGIERQTDIVERRRHETAWADLSSIVLIHKRFLKEKRGEEYAYTWHEVLQLRRLRDAFLLVSNWDKVRAKLLIDRSGVLLWSLISSSTSRKISAYRRWAVGAILATTLSRSSYAAVGCECRTKGTASRPWADLNQQSTEVHVTRTLPRMQAPQCSLQRSYLNPFYLARSQPAVVGLFLRECCLEFGSITNWSLLWVLGQSHSQQEGSIASLGS